MDTKTLRALKGSIRKWEDIIAGTGVDQGVDNCALCSLFYFVKKHCVSCLIFIETGKQYCSESPYADWVVHQLDWHHIPINKYHVICPTCRRLAKAELAFLKSLLPKEKP